jgi:Rps23 Pro-64 3,4-dihydroxylase Tpa1-like proline 4-hydroxylase
MFWNYLKEKNIVTGECNSSLRYHILHPQMYIKWHHDYEPDVMREAKYLGVTLFLNKQWSDDYGGHYLYKNHPLDTTGYFVSPIDNRLVINYTDLFHAVSCVSQNSNSPRHSLQCFIHEDYFTLDYKCKKTS